LDPTNYSSWTDQFGGKPHCVTERNAMPIKPPQPLPPPLPSNPTTGLVVSVNGTQYNVTPDPPPTPGQSWSTLHATLPPVSINVDTPTQPALIVNGWITAASSQDGNPTIASEALGASANDAVYGNSPNGTGVHGSSYGSSTSGVLGENAGAGVGVTGSSVAGTGVHGSSSGGSTSGVLGENTGAGVGVTGSSVSGNGIHGSSSSGKAGLFDGNVQVNGTLTIRTVDVAETITQLTTRITALEQQIAALDLQVTKLNTHYHNYGDPTDFIPDHSEAVTMQTVKDYILSATNSNLPGGNNYIDPDLDGMLVSLVSGTGKTIQNNPPLTSLPLYGTPGSGTSGS
jgi:hypothetical protein